MKLSFTRLNTLNIFVALAAIIFLIYANGLNTPFQSDDERHIYGTPQITNVDHYTNLSHIRNRHLSGLSFALSYQWGQENPFGYHLFNILIHISSTFLVFFIARLTIAKGTPWGEDAALKIALITALLFGLHPIQTETVTYISGRPGGLAGLFYFLSLLLFILASLKGSSVLRFVFYLLSLTSLFLAILSKESAITLPVMIIIYDLCFMQGSSWSSFRSRLGFYLCFPALAGATFFFAPNMLRFMDTLDFSGFIKIINIAFGLVQLDLLKHPLKLFLFPVNLTFEYDFPTQVSWASLLVSIAIVLLCIFLAVKKFYVKSSVLTFCVLWFPLTIAPTNSFMPRTHLFSERNMYIPSFGLCLFFAVLLYLIADKAKKRGMIWGAVLLIFIVFAITLAGALAIMLRIFLNRRINALVAGTRKVAEGDFGYRMEVGIPDEFGRIATAINEMVTRLEIGEENLRTALANAEQANQAKSLFLANMSHELRTPLNAIIGFADIIKNQHLGPDSVEKYSEYAQDIWASGNHLLTLVNHILNLSAIEAGQYILKKERFAVRQIVDDC